MKYSVNSLQQGVKLLNMAKNKEKKVKEKKVKDKSTKVEKNKQKKGKNEEPDVTFLDGLDPQIEEKSLGKELLTVLYYILFFSIVIGIFFNQASNSPKMIGKYGVFNVLTRSMQSTIPQGSLVITENVDASEIEIGDDITFMVGEKSTITHRVIGVIEDYDGNGLRAFNTQGTDNAVKDKDVAVETNVVGRVIFHSYDLGRVTVLLQENCYYIMVYLILFWVLKSIIIRFIGGDEEEDEDDDEEDEDDSEENVDEKRRPWKKRQKSKEPNPAVLLEKSQEEVITNLGVAKDVAQIQQSKLSMDMIEYQTAQVQAQSQIMQPQDTSHQEFYGTQTQQGGHAINYVSSQEQVNYGYNQVEHTPNQEIQYEYDQYGNLIYFNPYTGAYEYAYPVQYDQYGRVVPCDQTQ